MQNLRNYEWEKDYELYTPGQVENILIELGVEIGGETTSHLLGYCPVHGNTDSPALAVDKNNGMFHCFNPACEFSGSLEMLVQQVAKLNPFQSVRLIKKFETKSNISLSERVSRLRENVPTFQEFSQEKIIQMKKDFQGSVAQEYMRSRNFLDETLDYFDVGYSINKNLVVVPMHDPNGMPIGVIGRTPSHTEKRFQNSRSLPKSMTAWNFHRAKKEGEGVIVCEASYDAMRVHQAGYRNVIALLGGHITSHHVEQINKTFSSVTIMTDADKKQYYPNCGKCRKFKIVNGIRCQGHRPGRELGRSIAEKLSNKRIFWATFSKEVIYPGTAKDASDMTDSEIRACVKNAVPNLIYSQLRIEDSLA